MLTDEQKYENKKLFLELLGKLNIDLTRLVKYLDGPRADYFNKPASTQYQQSYAGGLCEHALAVYAELKKLCNLYFPDKYTEEDIIKVALFRDIYKAELYEVYNRNVKNDLTGQWETVAAYRNKEERPTFGDIGFSSYMIAKYFIDLNDEQILAICHSSGINSFAPDIHDIMQSYPLVTLTKMADIAATYLLTERA